MLIPMRLVVFDCDFDHSSDDKLANVHGIVELASIVKAAKKTISISRPLGSSICRNTEVESLVGFMTCKIISLYANFRPNYFTSLYFSR